MEREPAIRSLDDSRRDELERLLREHRSTLLRAARRMTRHDADAEDLVHEACLRALRGFDRFRSGTHFRAWMFRILRNVVVDEYHRRRRKPETVGFDSIVDADDAAATYLGSTSVFLPPRTRHADAMSARLESALAELPEDSRTALILAYVERLRYAEISEILHWPIGTVMSRLHRSRRRVRNRIQGGPR